MRLKQTRSFYPELWIQTVLFALIFLFFFVGSVAILVGLLFFFNSNEKGSKVFAIIGLIFFGPPLFVLCRGIWKMLLNRLVYLQKFSSHSEDAAEKIKIRLLYSLFRSHVSQTLISVIFERNNKEVRKDVHMTSPGLWLSSFSTGNELEGDLILRNGEPYLFRNSKYRIWLVSRDERDKPDGLIGKGVEKIEEKMKDIRQSQMSKI